MRKTVLSIMLVFVLLITMFSSLVHGEVVQDSPVEEEIEQKVLIIGIDGVRGDVAEIISERNNTTFGRIKATGAWSFNSSVGPLAKSGPGWSSMLTGVWCDRHGVVDNSFKGSKHSSVPDLFEYLEADDPNLRTAALHYWKKIGEEILNADSIDLLERYENDELIRNRSVELLTSDQELDVLFVSFDGPDDAGHEFGFSPDSPEYVAAVQTADDMATELINALEQRNLSKENWLVIIASDHGGGNESFYTHIPSNPSDQISFMLVDGGSTIVGEMTNNPVLVDVVVNALTHLNIPLPEGDLALDGRASAFDPDALPARQATCSKLPFYYQTEFAVGIVFGVLAIAVITAFIIIRKKRKLGGEPDSNLDE